MLGESAYSPSDRENSPARGRFLLLRCGDCFGALPLGGVVEVVRALAIRAIPGAPEFVMGVAVIRGEALPVVDLPRLLGVRPGEGPGRLVVIRGGARKVALRVEAVEGIRDLGELAQLPPLLQGAAGGGLEALRMLDGELVSVLDGARLAPPEGWSPPDLPEDG